MYWNRWKPTRLLSSSAGSISNGASTNVGVLINTSDSAVMNLSDS